MIRSQIFIADFLKALVDLRIDNADTARDVMRMLSLDSWTDITTSRAGSLAPPRPPRPRPISPEPAPTSALPGKTQPGPAAAEAPREGRSRAVARREPQPRQVAPPAWVNTQPALAKTGSTKSPPPDALFDPRQRRAILSSVAAAFIEDEVVDVDALIATVSRGEPVTRLPRRRAWGLRRGLDVLVDRGPGMAPFSADVERLMADLLELFPRDRVRAARFTGSPLRGVQFPKKQRTPWEPPPRDAAVLLISDLGASSGDERIDAAGVAEWLEFASAARRAGAQLRTLVPYPPQRWPMALAAPLRCIQWDRRTTAAISRRTLSEPFR